MGRIFATPGTGFAVTRLSLICGYTVLAALSFGSVGLFAPLPQGYQVSHQWLLQLNGFCLADLHHSFFQGEVRVELQSLPAGRCGFL